MSAMPLEADTRVLIDKRLENLGWRLKDENDKKRNVYFEQPKTDAEKKKLDGKRPDYVLYSDEYDGQALIVIEAKKKGERIDTALEQGILYAKQLNAPLVFATDGLFCKSYHVTFGKTPLLNGEEVDEFLREALAVKYIHAWEVNTISPKVQYARRELVKIFDEANNMLRADGLRAGIERFGEFANILFLKLISESEHIKRETGIPSSFNTLWNWDTIQKIPIHARIEYINNIVYKSLNDLYQTDIFTPLTMRDNAILKDIMDKLSPLTLTDVDSDVKGDAFEYFLKASASSKNDLGEYFTPRHIVKTMVNLVNPQIGEKVYDPFCGTGGFLIESFRHIHNIMPRNATTETMLREHTVFGNEITNTARITKMNMILTGDGHSNVDMKDSLANPVDGKYDIVLTNMPYSQKTKHGTLYDLPSNNGDSICVQHCMKAISATSENGRMAMVIPEGFLFRKDLAKARELLLSHCQLQSIISLPQGVFLPYTGVKTNILYATKVNQKIKSIEKRTHFWYFPVKNDGYSLDNHRRKIEGNNDLDIFQQYSKLDDAQKQDMLNAGFEAIPLDKVRDNGFILLGSRYRERILEKIIYEYKSLKDVCMIIAGQSPDSEHYNTIKDGLPFYQGNANFDNVYIQQPKIWTTHITKEAIENDVLLSVRAPVGAVNICTGKICIGRGLMAIRCNENILYKYLFYILKVLKNELKQLSLGTTFEAVTKKDIEDFLVPLPPLEVQQQIVDELESYQRIIDGSRLVVESYKPILKIPKKCTLVKIIELCKEVIGGGTPSTENKEFWGGQIPWITSADIDDENNITKRKYITELGVEKSTSNIIPKNNVIVASRVALGKIAINNFDVAINQDLQGFILDKEKVLTKYFIFVYPLLLSQIVDKSRGTTIKGIIKKELLDLSIPVPPLEVQKHIVSQIEFEQNLIESSKQLIELFTQKIQDRINEIWSEQSD